MDALLLLRILLIGLIAFLFLYLVNEEVELWCNDTCSRYTSKYDRVIHNLSDSGFVIPEEARKPKQSMKEYYADHKDILTNLLMGTRLKYQEQYHTGTVLRDGFNADLPENAMWKNGVVVIGEDIRELNIKEAAKGKKKTINPTPTPVENPVTPTPTAN